VSCDDPPDDVLNMGLFLSTKGKHILRENTTPADDLEALHEIIRKAFVDVGTYENSDITADLGERLSSVLNREVLPETHLLLALFPAKAVEQRIHSVDFNLGRIQEHLRSVTVGEPLRYKNLCVFPISGGNGKPSEFTTLEAALKKKDAEITEVSSGGEVPFVNLVNRGKMSILLPEGELLIGAMQNRVVNISMVAAAAATTKIPVSCVEQGRWHTVSSSFEAAYHAPPSVRAVKTKTVNENVARSGSHASDQGAVWHSVESMLSDMDVASETSDMSELYKQQQDRIEGYRKNIKLPTDARGMLFTAGGKFLGFDIFDSKVTLKKYWKKISESYFMEASRITDDELESEMVEVELFMNVMTEYIDMVDEPVGEGVEFQINSEGIAGSGVWHGDKVCHLSAFSLVE